MNLIIQLLAYLWAAPWTLVGLTIGAVGRVTGGHSRRWDGVWEFWGGSVKWVLRRAPFVADAAALTLGHVVLGQSEYDLDEAHEHEMIHVRQYERWGPLFIPCYLLSSLFARCTGRSAYYDNVFEREAYGRLERRLGEGPVARVCVLLALLLATICATTTLATFAGRRWWLFELTCHFVVCYAIGLGLAVLLLWINGRFRMALLAVPFLIVNLWGIVPLYVAVRTPHGSTSVVRIVSTNVLSSNPHSQPLLGWVRVEKPDIIVGLEIDERWSSDLMSLSDEYPHRIAAVRNDNFGIVLLSRQPAAFHEIRPLGGIQVPCIVARFEFASRPLTVIGIHVIPPMSARDEAERNRELADVIEIVRQQPQPVILVGDFNCTSWSPVFQDLLRETRLRDSRRGFGLQASWPTFLGRFGLPIDHGLVSREVEVTARRIGPRIGSDHFPVLVDLRLGDTPPNRE